MMTNYEKKVKKAEDKYTKVLPTDYLKYSEEKRHDDALAAIWKHVGKVKQYVI